jgi:hypothetical protein
VTNASANAFAHRAIVSAHVAGLCEARRGLRVVVAGADASPHEGDDASADLIVMTDEGAVDDDGVEAVMRRARHCVGDAGVVALVVGSLVTRELVEAAAEAEAGAAMPPPERRDAHARAMRWARERSRDDLAPAVSPERLVRITLAAAAAGLLLVEPASTVMAPSLARVRRMKSPRARALLAIVALGVSARPLLFVPSRRAPKGGLARMKVERIADGWVAIQRPFADGSILAAPQASLVRAALGALDDAARAQRPPMPFKVLLREARERQAAAARELGVRAGAGASDTADLAALLHHQAAVESLLLYVLDPADPGWSLRAAPPGLTL